MARLLGISEDIQCIENQDGMSRNDNYCLKKSFAFKAPDG